MKAKDFFRAKWSKEGLEVFLENPKRRGVAWPCRNNPHCVRVKWDGNLTASTYHKAYIAEARWPK